jgi:hypothetical protein
MISKMYSIVEAYSTLYPVVIVEEFHPLIKEVMDSEKISPQNKLSMVTKKARELIKSGVDTGMESDKPKKGSSRAVFFSKDKKEITLDGQKTHTPTAVKIAFAGTLDKHHGEDSLLGEDQNSKESDGFINHHYGILHNDDDNRGNYLSSRHESGGVLAPVFETHPENHYLEMGRVTPASTKDVEEATKTKDFPKGLKHDEIKDAMTHEHNSAHGTGLINYGDTKNEENMERIKSHPWVEHAIDMMHNSGMHPGDLNKRNMGIYHHPITGKKHLAIIDYGFSDDIAKKYTKARRNSYLKSNRY